MSLPSWLFTGALTSLAITLGALQYGWIAEVSQAERERLHSTLQSALDRIRQDFDYQLRSAVRSAMDGTGHAPLLRSVAITAPPEFRDRQAPLRDDLITMPVPPSRGGPPAREWVAAELDLNYVRNRLLPELIARDLGAHALEEYRVRVVSASDRVIYDSDPSRPLKRSEADASGPVFGGPFEAHHGPPGRWTILVRSTSGSLEAIVSKSRMRNLTVSVAMLGLILAAGFALEIYIRRAHRLAAMQAEFVAAVSHELRTPIAVIRTAAYNLQSHALEQPGRVHRYGELIQRESERLGDMVNQVLSFSRSGMLDPAGSKQYVDIPEVLDAVLEEHRDLITASASIVETRTDPDLPGVLGDPTTLRQALANLLANAVKYGRGGAIGVSAQCNAQSKRPEVEIRISDQGFGIPADEMNRIFEPFYRGRAAVAARVHGTGLGLSIVKRTVEAQGGMVSVSSTEGYGTEFVLRFPAVTAGRNEA